MKDRNACARAIERYMAALDAGDYQEITSLFASDGRVVSPFLGEMDARAFFDKLASASSNNVITPMGVFLPADEREQAVAYFQYDWTLQDGTQVTFKVFDLFTFSEGTEKFSRLEIVYDTHPVRAIAGDKYG